MELDVHLRNYDGTPGAYQFTIERIPKYRKSDRREWVTFGDESFPLIQPATPGRPFICVPRSAIESQRQLVGVVQI